MVPIVEFIERLEMGKRANIRNCDDEIEEERYKNLKGHMAEEFKYTDRVETTYWQYRKTQESKNFKDFVPKQMGDFHKQILDMIPLEAHQPINLQSYCQFLEELYTQDPEDANNAL